MFHPLSDLSALKTHRTHRSSSYDPTGGNIDFRRIRPAQSLKILDVEGPGVITHLWFALMHTDLNYLRSLVIRAWWDGAREPAIECPLGDFLGVGHAVANRYECLLLDMVRGSGLRGDFSGGNCRIPMPFSRHARIEVFNESPWTCQACYYTVNWHSTDVAAVEETGRLHARWHRENPKGTTPVAEETMPALGRFGANRSGADNYTVLDVRGEGRLLGMNLSVDNIHSRVLDSPVTAFGEGDEMIFIDEECWPPRLHGTGTEDYFTHAWGMNGAPGLFAGVSLSDELFADRRPRGTCYRFHVHDPVFFNRSLKFTFEHGPNNCQANDLSSTVYWYQREAEGQGRIVPRAARLPLADPQDPDPADENRVIDLVSEAVDLWYDLFLEGSREAVNAASRGIAGDTLGVASDLRTGFRDGKVGMVEVREKIATRITALRKIRG